MLLGPVGMFSLCTFERTGKPILALGSISESSGKYRLLYARILAQAPLWWLLCVKKNQGTSMVVFQGPAGLKLHRDLLSCQRV